VRGTTNEYSSAHTEGKTSWWVQRKLKSWIALFAFCSAWCGKYLIRMTVDLKRWSNDSVVERYPPLQFCKCSMVRLGGSKWVLTSHREFKGLSKTSVVKINTILVEHLKIIWMWKNLC
jgi:hypothetical protein